MAITHFRPEQWASELIEALRATLVFASPQIVNHDYEGDIQRGGETVHISMIGDVEVTDYVKGQQITYDDPDDAGTELVIDQLKKWAVKLEDVDAAQSVNGGEVMSQLMMNAAYNLKSAMDGFVASMYTQVQSANVLTAVTSLGGDGADADTMGEAAYELLVDLGVALDEASVPEDGRYVVVPPWYHGVLRKARSFINVEKAGDGGAALRNGQVGMAAGFDILKSNNTAVPTTGTNVIQAGTPMAISVAEQIVKTDAFRLQDYFADAVRGLHVYGGKVVRPDALACVTVTRPTS